MTYFLMMHFLVESW